MVKMDIIDRMEQLGMTLLCKIALSRGRCFKSDQF